MDRILSARINDSIYRKINELSKKMHTSKKSVIESAILLLVKQFDQKSKTDVFFDTCGIWERTENVQDTVSEIKTAFRNSMERYQR